MGKDILTFDNTEFEKNKVYLHNTPILLEDVDIEKVLVSNKISLDETNYKYLYNNDEVKSLHIIPPKTSAYVKIYNGQTKWMYFLIEDGDLIEIYNTTRDKISADIKKELDSEPVYNKNYLKTKRKSHGDKVTDNYDKKNRLLFSCNYLKFCSLKKTIIIRNCVV